MRAHSIEPDARRFIVCDDNTGEAAYRAVRNAWRSMKSCSAVFAGNDRIASGIYRIVAEYGLRVPRDLSVVGFDDLELAKDPAPPLSTIRVDIEEMGRWTCRLLLQQLRDHSVKPVRMLLPVDLIERASCERPAVN